MSVLKGFLLLTIESTVGWLRQNAILYASSLAYFTIFSLAPLVLLTTAIPSFIFGSTAVEEQFITLSELTGGTALAGMVTEVLTSSQVSASRSGPLLALISLGVILFGASLVFRQLQLSINVMWGLEVEPLTPKREDLWRNGLIAARKFLVATVAALAGGFLLLVTLLTSAIGSALMQKMELLTTTQAQVLVSLLNFVAVPVAYTLIFACIFKYLPQGQVRWRDLWPGTIITALLFWLAGYGISVYLAFSTLESVYGAASSLFGFLIWVFTSTSIILFGAKFIQLYAARYGVPIVPEEGMILKPLPSLALPGGVAEWLKQ